MARVSEHVVQYSGPLTQPSVTDAVTVTGLEK